VARRPLLAEHARTLALPVVPDLSDLDWTAGEVPTRACLVCCAKFVPFRNAHRYCTRRCAAIAQRERARQAKP
jgi:predicted nucleic acid-binding Zn ribbon protein